MLWKAWVCDDAFITFRHVAHLLGGYGPVFNPGERVQAFTHPLWFWLLATGGLVVDVYAAAVGAGVLLTVVLFVILAWHLRRRPHRLVLLILAFLVLFTSRTFVEYQTSGLENSLTNLLVVALVGLLCSAWLDGRALSFSTAAWLCGLLVLNRPDHAMFVAPVAAVVLCNLVRGRSRRAWLEVLAAAVSVFGWYGFAALYYGTPLPNTAYAKVVMPWPDAVAMGSAYLVDYVRHEPLHAGVVLAAVLGGLWAGVRGLRRCEPGAGVPIALAAAIALHLAYVLYVGGDYMRGRFVDAALVASVAMGVHLLSRFLPMRENHRAATCAAAVFGAMVFILQMQSPQVLRCSGRGIEWIYFAYPPIWIIAAAATYLAAAILLLRKAQGATHPRAGLVFCSALVLLTFLSISLLGYRPPDAAVLVVLLVAGLATSFALARGLAGAGLGTPSLAFVALIVAATGSLCDIDRRSESGSGAISDEFTCYHIRGWRNPFRHPVESLRGTVGRWYRIGRTAQRYAETCGPITVAYDSLGVISYYSGPNVRVIDLCGLAEPYLNRSPTPPCRRPGHVLFQIPPGYLAARGTINLLPDWFNRLERCDPTLASDADRLSSDAAWAGHEDLARWQSTRLIISGDLLSAERFRAMPRYIFPERRRLDDESACRRALAELVELMY